MPEPCADGEVAPIPAVRGPLIAPPGCHKLVCGIHRAGFGCLFRWRRAGNSLRILAPRNLDLPGRANILETAPQQPQSPPSEEEREQQRCSALLRDDGPQPRSLLPVERAEIGRFLKTNHSLAQFRHDGIERLLGNASVLPDGRALFVFSSQPRSQIAILAFLAALRIRSSAFIDMHLSHRRSRAFRPKSPLSCRQTTVPALNNARRS
jgi:hypothetical protein